MMRQLLWAATVAMCAAAYAPPAHAQAPIDGDLTRAMAACVPHYTGSSRKVLIMAEAPMQVANPDAYADDWKACRQVHKKWNDAVVARRAQAASDRQKADKALIEGVAGK